MLSQIPFSSNLPLSASHLPLTLISLEEWALVTLRGKDTIQYLQGQLTCDIASLDPNHFSFAAHCDANGKMFSNLYVFHYEEGIGYIERRSVRDNQLAALKKYAVFSKTVITKNDQVALLGIAGFQAEKILSRLFKKQPNEINPVMRNQEITSIHLRLPTSRFLLITTKKMYTVLQQQLKSQVKFNDSKQWLALDIEAGYPILDSANSKKFIPQAANIQALQGISFNKGCYIGQEMIARTKYRRTNKRALYWLSGTTNSIPIAGDDLELKIECNWRRAGKVLAACRLKNGSAWIQAILHNNLNQDSLLRVQNDSSSLLKINQLPYSISD